MPRTATDSDQYIPQGQEDDVVRSMMVGASRHPLLTVEQELRYGSAVQGAIALIQDLIERHPEELKQIAGNFDGGGVRIPGTFKQSAVVCLKVASEQEAFCLKAGMRAIDKFVACNFRLAMSVAKKYNPRIKGRSMCFEDICQEGAAGLMRAAEKFDPKRGYKFSTYCYWWIRQAVMRAIANASRSVRLPIHIHEDLAKLRKLQAQWAQAGKSFNHGQLACALYPQKNPKQALEKYWLIRMADLRPYSLDLPVGEKGDTTLGDFLPSEVDVEQDAEAQMFSEQVQVAIDALRLSPREKKLLNLRVMSPPGQKKSLAETGTALGDISRERTRQLQAALLRKLRHSRTLRELAENL